MSALGGRIAALQRALADLGALDAPLEEAARATAAAIAAGGTVLVAGNGGSAAEAQHLTAEMVGRLLPTRERGPLPAVSLHADTSTLTAVANDYGYDQVFARQVQALGRPGDVLIVLSTSGASPNLVAAVAAAEAAGLVTVGLVGAGDRPLHRGCTHVLAVPDDAVATIQECHLVLVHAFVEAVETALGVVGS